MTKPLFVINSKAYEQAYGKQLIIIAKAIEEAAQIRGIKVILCVPASEIANVRAATKLVVYAQHVDSFAPGAYTGWLPPEALLAAGAQGTLLNHSEHRIQDIEKTVKHAQAAGLPVILCVQDALEAKIYRNLPVQYIAVEPPELIGGDVSVSTARPELIEASVKNVPDKLLVGAGVKTHNDVAISMKLGAKGVLLASGVMKASKPKEVLLEIFSGW